MADNIADTVYWFTFHFQHPVSSPYHGDHYSGFVIEDTGAYAVNSLIQTRNGVYHIWAGVPQQGDLSVAYGAGWQEGTVLATNYFDASSGSNRATVYRPGVDTGPGRGYNHLGSEHGWVVDSKLGLAEFGYGATSVDLYGLGL